MSFHTSARAAVEYENGMDSASTVEDFDSDGCGCNKCLFRPGEEIYVVQEPDVGDGEGISIYYVSDIVLTQE